MTIRVQPGLSPAPPVPITLATAPWCGWIRTTGHWRAVCGDVSYDGCWGKLLDIPGGPRVERMVCPKGKRP